MKKRILLNGLLMLLAAATIVSCSPSDEFSQEVPPQASDSNNDYVTPPSYSEASFQIHYRRTDRYFDKWAIWTWADAAEGQEFIFNGVDEYGAIASYPLSAVPISEEGKLGFIIRTAGSWTAKDIGDDRFIDFSLYEKDSNQVFHIYLRQDDANVYSTIDGKIIDNITLARLNPAMTISIATTNAMSYYKIFSGNTVIAEQTLATPSKTVLHKFNETRVWDVLTYYDVEVIFAGSKEKMKTMLDISVLYTTEDFNNSYFYDGTDLGATYSKTSTLFKVWSPLSTKITLKVYDNGTPTSVSESKGNDTTLHSVDLIKGSKGVWNNTITGDLAGKYYTFTVHSRAYPNGREIVDPYARSAGVSGLRGQIVDFSAINNSISGWNEFESNPYDRKELVVYETHIADITSSSTWTSNSETRKLEKTFAGAYKTGTTYTSNGVTVTTGFDHIKEMGVNAVQLVPVFDQANNETKQIFNWGYNPLNYNVVEGLYSSDPFDGYARIREYKQLIKAYGDEGINIIMDVVYNHVNGISGSNFDVLMPGYYFRYTNLGAPSNGSGCGNETASERSMVRKFMIESATFWAKEYKLGGFRFDLMALHDIDTMNQLTAKVKAINNNIVVYGEPWTGGGTTLEDSKQAKQSNTNHFQGYGQFNDQMRDALIKSGMGSVTNKGWVTANSEEVSSLDTDKIVLGVRGQTTSSIKDPNKIVNYATCHDNYTLYDRIRASGINDSSIVKKMAMLANSVVLTSQGTTFMLAGEEFLRTKGGNHNSYDASYKVNELDYDLKIKNYDMVMNYRTLINLKINNPGLQFDEGGIASNVSASINKNVLTLEFRYIKEGLTRHYKVVHVNGLSITSTANFSGYSMILDTMYTGVSLSASTPLQKYQTIVAVKVV